jgi:hypothetical protein
METTLLNYQPVLVYTWVPPDPALVSFGSSYICVLLFASILVISSLIELSPLWGRPSNHGLPIEVNLPILFPHHSTYDHDELAIILVWALAPARLISYWETPRTWSLAWLIDILLVNPSFLTSFTTCCLPSILSHGLSPQILLLT